MYDRVLIAVDGSDEATRAASHGLAFARAFGAAAEVLHVIDKKARRLAKSDDERAQLRDWGESILAEIEELASANDQCFTTTLKEGPPEAAISEHAADREADLIGVARQGLTGFADGIREYVANHELNLIVGVHAAGRTSIASGSRASRPPS